METIENLTRSINGIITVHCSPYPEELTEKFGGAKLISELDMMKGYHQVPMKTEKKRICHTSWKISISEDAIWTSPDRRYYSSD